MADIESKTCFVDSIVKHCVGQCCPSEGRVAHSPKVPNLF
jgi:hypothetical protein